MNNMASMNVCSHALPDTARTSATASPKRRDIPMRCVAKKEVRVMAVVANVGRECTAPG
jgi:hypothetical protein